MADLTGMSDDDLKGAYYREYGASLAKPAADNSVASMSDDDLQRAWRKSLPMSVTGAPPAGGVQWDDYLRTVPLGRVLNAFGQGAAQGFGTERLGLSDKVEQGLKDAGIFPDVEKGQGGLLRAFNEGLIRPAAATLDLANRSLMAGFRATQGAVAQVGEELPQPRTDFGNGYIGESLAALASPRQLFRDIAAFPEAMPGGNVPHVPDLAAARELGVIGGTEGTYLGTASREATQGARDTPFSYAPNALGPDARAEPSIAAYAPTITTPTDIHQAARQIAPRVFTEYDDLATLRDSLRDQIQREQDALHENAGSQAPHAAEIADLEDRIPGATPRLAKKYEARLATLRPEHDAFLEDRFLIGALTRDTPEITALREQLLKADFRMRDLAPDVSGAYRRAEADYPNFTEQASAPLEARGNASEAAPAGAPEPIAAPATPEPVTAPAPAAAASETAPKIDIAKDVTDKLIAAGRPRAEAEASGQLLAAHYEARAARFGGAKGTAADLYAAEAPEIRGEAQRPAPAAVAAPETPPAAPATAEAPIAAPAEPEPTPAPAAAERPRIRALPDIIAEDKVGPAAAQRIQHQEMVALADWQAGNRTAPIAAPAPPPATPAAAVSIPTEAPASSPMGIQSVDPATIKVDASRFQFKEGGDESGVTERLQGVKKWDPMLAGTVMVWRDAQGQDWIADGHQRLGLAQRMMADGQTGIRLNAFVLDEKSGVTDSQARAIAAAKNIAEGTGTAIDAAKVIREAAASGVDLPPLPPRSVLVRDGQSLARLSPEAFGMAVNDVVPIQQAAIVGRLVEDAAQQSEAIRVLAELRPENARQAESIVRELLASGTQLSTQDSLFGTEQIASSVVLERAKVIDEATRQLGRDRQTFSTLVTRADEIQTAGNQLSEETNRARLTTDERATQLLQTLATTRGPVSTALSDIAREFKSGSITRADAGRRFLGVVRGAIEKGLDTGADAGGLRSGEPEAAGVAERELFQRKPRNDPNQGGLFGAAPTIVRDQRERVATVRNDPNQIGMPGMEPSAVQAQAARDQAGRGALLAKVDQKPADEGLFAPKDPGSPTLFQGARGKIHMGSGRSVITLMRDANASTFMHETGHAWLEELLRDGQDERAPAELVTDVQTVRSWLGAKGDGPITTKQHEKFARGFERYLMEGTAPSRQLAGVFAQFRQWLTGIYQTVQRLRAPITADIRDVFDRLLTNNPERTTIAREEASEGSHTPETGAKITADLAVVHETDSVMTAPEEAAAAADAVRDERLEATANHAPELGSDNDRGPTGEAGGGAGPSPTQPGGGDGAGARPGETGNVSESGSLGGSGGGAASKGDSAPKGEQPGSPNKLFDPAGTGDVDKAGNIRLDLLNQPEDVDNVIRQAAAENNDFLAARRGAISDSAVLGLADALGMDAATLNRRRLGQAFNAEEVVAARRLLVQSAQTVRDAMARAAEGSDADVLAYAEAKTRHQMIQEHVAGITAEAGRALRAFRSLDGLKDAQELGEFLRDNTGRTLFQLRTEAQLGLKLDSPQKLSKFLNDTKKPDFWDKAIEYWVNGLISGPATHTTYSEANALLVLWKAVPETAMSAAVGSLRHFVTGTEDRVMWGEVGAQLHGIIQGIREGTVAAGKALQTGDTTALPGEPIGRLSYQNYRQAIPGPIGTIVRLPSRGVATIHSFFRAIGYSQAKAALAYRQAAQEGLIGNAFAQRVGELSTNPSPELMQAARLEATEQTLMGSGSAFTKAVAQLSNQRLLGVPFFKFVMPFVKIGANIMSQGLLERTPIGLLDPDIRANLLGRNGAIARDTQVARLSVGTAVGAMTMGLAAQGFITGGGPHDPKEAAAWRLTGRQPYSVRIGDTWYGYHRLGPIGLMLGVSADMYELGHAVTHETADHVAGMIVGSVTHGLLDETWMRGLSQMIEAATDPGRYGAKWARDEIASWVPFSVGMAQIARASDPFSRQARTVLDAIKAKVPVWSQSLRPRLDIWGQPVPSLEAFGPEGLSAIYESKVSNDPVNQAIFRLHAMPDAPERKIRGVDLTDEQYDEYARTAGRMAKMRLDALVNQPGFTALPEGIQAQTMREFISGARETARSLLMMKHPDIIKSAIDHKQALITGPVKH